MFAPCLIGFNNAGVATVLSTIKGTLATFACSEIASKSRTSNFGFPRDSTKKALVFSWVASAKLLGSEASTKVVVIPNLGKVTFNKLNVPPYRLLDATMWSPDFSKVNNPVAIAAEPEAKATAPTPPSKVARRSCNIWLVGLFKRV